MPQVRSEIVDVYVFRRASEVAVEFLMLLRAEGTPLAGTWQSVHGHIEPGETAHAAARRELREETGLTLRRFWQLEHVNAFYVASQDAIHLCPSFLAEVEPHEAVRLSDEHCALRWVSGEEARREFLWPGQRAAVREAVEEIIAGGRCEPLLRLTP